MKIPLKYLYIESYVTLCSLTISSILLHSTGVRPSISINFFWKYKYLKKTIIKFSDANLCISRKQILCCSAHFLQMRPVSINLSFNLTLIYQSLSYNDIHNHEIKILDFKVGAKWMKHQSLEKLIEQWTRSHL